MKRKQGRPTKPASERRSAVVHYRMTRAELRELAASAKREGLSISDYIRKRLHGKGAK